MAYQFSFCDNATYGAEDVNRITSRLVTCGVADVFENGVAYNASKFNEAGELLYTSGVVPETVGSLKVTKKDDATITIAPGTAFFKDGAVIEITAGGHDLPLIAGEKCYVYLKNNLTDNNTCEPACTTTAPSGDVVMLAEIEPDGTIIDKRTYAMGKLPGYQSNAMSVLKIEDTAVREYHGSTREERRSYTVGNNNYRYMLAVQDKNGGGGGVLATVDLVLLVKINSKQVSEEFFIDNRTFIFATMEEELWRTH